MSVSGFVRRIGTVALGIAVLANGAVRRDRRVPFDASTRAGDERARALIDEAASEATRGGGAFEVAAAGVPAGLGSHAQWNSKLDGRLAQALMSIPAIEAVEVGDGVAAAIDARPPVPRPDRAGPAEDHRGRPTAPADSREE